MARAPKKPENPLLGGKFAVQPFTDEQIDETAETAREMGFVNIFWVGERADGRCGFVTGNMASVNHMIEVMSRAMNQFPHWQPSGPAHDGGE
jgi:hypothetical protein